MNIKLLKYVFIGACSTIIHINFAYLYLYFVDNSIFLSNIVGFLIAFGFSYTLQSKFVFQSYISVKKAMKYFIVQIVSLFISISLSQLLKLSNTYLEVLIVVIILPLITYFTHKIWTFKENV